MKKKRENKRVQALVLALVLLTGSMDVPALATENKPEAVSVSANDIFGNYSGQNAWKEQKEQQEQQEQNAPQESAAGTEDITAEKADDTSTYGPYGLLVGGVIVDADNAKDVFGDGTVSYDAASNTLTLKNANITGGTLKIYEDNTLNYGIFMPDEDANLNIILEGENFVSAQEEQVSQGIAVSNKLTISGSGSLVVRGSDSKAMSCGFWVGSLLISGTVNVSVQSGMSEENVSFGIYAHGEEGITISEHAKVTVQCGSGQDASYAIFAEYGDINFLDSCIVETTAPYDATYPMAIATYSSIVIEQGSTVNADGQTDLWVLWQNPRLTEH